MALESGDNFNLDELDDGLADRPAEIIATSRYFAEQAAALTLIPRRPVTEFTD